MRYVIRYVTKMLFLPVVMEMATEPESVEEEWSGWYLMAIRS